MKKILLSGFLLLSITLHAQIIQTPLQSDYCTNQTIDFTYSIPAPAGSHYEWMYEDYTQGWSPVIGPVNVMYIGQAPSIQVYTGSIGFCCMVRLLTVDDITGQYLNSENKAISTSKGSGNIPYIFHTNYSTCGSLEVPPLLANIATFPLRWAMWYRNGQATGVTDYYYSNLTDSAWYEYKVRLQCGDTLTTGPIFYQGSKDPILTATTPTTICTGDSVTLSLTAFESIDTWYKNGVAINGSFGKSTLKVGETGQYTAKTKRQVSSGVYCYQTSNTVAVTVNPGAFITGTEKFCGGDSVKLTCTAASTYQWKKNGVNISGATSQSIWVKTTGNYTVNTTGLTCNSSPAKTATNYPVPYGLSITPSGTYSLCSGSAVNIGISGNNITNWQWYRTGTSMPGANSSGIVATKNGNYKCVVTNAIGCSKTSATVQVSAAPVATLPQKTLVLQPGTEGMDSYITSNFGNYTTNFGTAATIEISNWYKYFRNAERGYLQFDLSQIPDFSAVTSATLKLFVDSIAQKNVNPNTPNSLFIKRNTQPWTESTISWSNSPDSTEYQSVAIPCSTITSSSFLSASIVDLVRHWVNTPTERFGMILQLNDYYQISWLKIASSDTAAPTYRPKLTVTYYAADINASGPLNICTGGSVQFTTNVGAYTYQWYKNGNAIAGATASSYTATTAGDYHVVLTAASGCTARSLVKKVTLNGLPQINLTPSADSVSYCNGSPIQLKADSLAGYTFLWKKNNVNIAGAVYSNYSPTTTAWYTIKTTSNCGISAKDSIYVTRVNNAAPVITAGGPTTFCAGQNVVLTATTIAGAVTQWYKNSILTSSGTSYTATTAGAYYVVQTASGCSKTSNTITTIVNCREGEFFANQEISLQVYPNPASDHLQIELSGLAEDQESNITLSEISGKTIMTTEISNGQLQLPVQHISDGLYLITIRQNGNIAALQRVMIRH